MGISVWSMMVWQVGYLCYLLWEMQIVDSHLVYDWEIGGCYTLRNICQMTGVIRSIVGGSRTFLRM